MAKIESTGGQIKIMLVIKITKIKLTGGQIEFMLIIEMAKTELTGGHIRFLMYRTCIDYQNEIGIMLIIEMAKIEINRRLYWIYANCRDGQNRNNWRPH